MWDGTPYRDHLKTKGCKDRKMYILIKKNHRLLHPFTKDREKIFLEACENKGWSSLLKLDPQWQFLNYKLPIDLVRKNENQEVQKHDNKNHNKKKPKCTYLNVEETAESVWGRQLMADLEEAPIATECSSVLVSVGTAAAAGERAPTPTSDV